MLRRTALRPYHSAVFTAVFWFFLFTLIILIEVAVLPSLVAVMHPWNSIFLIATVAVLFFEPRWGFVVAVVGSALVDAITLTPGRFLLGLPLAIGIIHLFARHYLTNRSLWAVASLTALGTIVVQIGERSVTGTVSFFLENTVIQMFVHGAVMLFVAAMLRVLQRNRRNRGNQSGRPYETVIYS